MKGLKDKIKSRIARIKSDAEERVLFKQKLLELREKQEKEAHNDGIVKQNKEYSGILSWHTPRSTNMKQWHKSKDAELLELNQRFANTPIKKRLQIMARCLRKTPRECNERLSLLLHSIDKNMEQKKQIQAQEIKSNLDKEKFHLALETLKTSIQKEIASTTRREYILQQKKLIPLQKKW